MKDYFYGFIKYQITIFSILFFFSVSSVFAAAQVTLEWDPNIPTPDGYKTFMRIEGENYDYDNPVWTGVGTTCIIENLADNQSYYFVVRAFDNESESGDSNEVFHETGSSNQAVNEDVQVSLNGSNSSSYDQPIIAGPFENIVPLTPFLEVNENHDQNGYGHIMTRWQISTEPDFSNFILDISSSLYLYSYQVPYLVLDTDTTYYWRAKFYYEGDVESNWSEFQSFTTIAAQESDDTDLNGIPDAQEIDEALDLDGDGLNDHLQDNILTANSMIGSCRIGVKSISENTTLVALKPVGNNYNAHALHGQPESMSLGLICFKLYLNGDETSAIVKVYFSKKARLNAKWYKYDSNEGWQSDENAVFSDDRKSITLTLVDGGFGDEDGVRNGIIVDPSGLGENNASVGTKPNSSITDLNLDTADISGCFISSVKETKRLEKIEIRPLFKSVCLWFSLIMFLFTGLCLNSGRKAN